MLASIAASMVDEPSIGGASTPGASIAAASSSIGGSASNLQAAIAKDAQNRVSVFLTPGIYTNRRPARSADDGEDEAAAVAQGERRDVEG